MNENEKQLFIHLVTQIARTAVELNDAQREFRPGFVTKTKREISAEAMFSDATGQMLEFCKRLKGQGK